jgi:hypothetical protein
MDTVLSDYFREALIHQLDMYGATYREGNLPLVVEDGLKSESSGISAGLEMGGIGGGGAPFSQTNIQIE